MYIVFAIDNDKDLHTNARFLRYVDECQAMMKMKGKMQLCIGCYFGELERSYIMLREDFDDWVRQSGYVDEQESFMLVENGHKGSMFAYLQFADGREESLGQLLEVPPSTALRGYAWTYRPDMDKYFATKDVVGYSDNETMVKTLEDLIDA